MAPKKTTTSMTDAQIKALIAQGVADALAKIKANSTRKMVTTAVILELAVEGLNILLWIEKMESVFHISNCTVACQIKYATCTLQGNALTWWNSHIKTVTHKVSYAIIWKTLKKMMTHKYCPRGEIKKLEIEIWNLKVKESDEVEEYVGGLPDMIHGSVMASKPKTMQDAIEFATELMDQKIRTIADRQIENKRKLDDNSSDNNAEQPPFERQNVARAYSARPSEKKEYAGTLPLCNKCKLITMGRAL
nr:hypothetical protein [Tanacetum cinerariifolium]